MVCERCNKEHNGSYGSGRYCSEKCARARTLSNESREKISKALKGKEKPNKIIHLHICENCGDEFEKYLKKGRKKHCNNCKRKVPRARKPREMKSILELSNRTVQKLFRRANIGCSICSWKESTCDIHHIISKKDGGSDENTNLICVCPNHHRMIHDKKINKYSLEFLKERNVNITFSNWKDYYNKN